MTTPPRTLSTALLTPSPYLVGYDIEPYFIDALRDTLQGSPADKVFFFTERGLLRGVLSGLYERTREAFPTALTCVPEGEKGKGFSALEEVLEGLIAGGATKRSLLIAAGGGAVGNLVGLAAGLLFRGVRYVEVPTTMTGQTDSVLSNTQAINGKTGKNQFGLYHAPTLVWGDARYLETEPTSARRGGVVEGVKNGLIHDPALLTTLEPLLEPTLSHTGAALADLALTLIRSKLPIIQEDPTERGYGLVLEYGHTFGHALEFLMAGRLLHGEAVGVGMRLAARLSRRLGHLDEGAVSLHDRLLVERVGLSPHFPASVSAEALVKAMGADNKRTGAELRCVLLERVGRCLNPRGDWLVDVDEALVRAVVADFIEEVGVADLEPPSPRPAPLA